MFSLKIRAQKSSYDNTEWQELKSRITNHSIIGLGEIGHGYESINTAKSVLLDFLYNKLNFKAIVFESSFTECIVSFLKSDSLNNRFTVKYSSVAAKFNAIIYLDKLKKINSKEWVTLCD